MHLLFLVLVGSVLSIPAEQPSKARAVMMPVLQVRTPMHGEGKQLAWGHTASRGRRQGLDQELDFGVLLSTGVPDAERLAHVAAPWVLVVRRQ